MTGTVILSVSEAMRAAASIDGGVPCSLFFSNL